MSLLVPTDAGLCCPAGGFHVDPHGPCALAVVTHAHADHAQPLGVEAICAAPGAALVRHRLGEGARVRALDYGERVRLGETTVSLHPAGHMLGSAQVRIEAGGRVWVVAGDYKRDPDPTCAPFEVVRCDGLVTEATFALPVYAWPPVDQVMAELLAWWDENAAAGRASVLLCYAMGKAQRVLAELARLGRASRPVLLHGAMETPVALYREAGVALAPTALVRDAEGRRDWAGELVLAPPSAHRSRWMRRFGGASVAMASGFMRLRGTRRRRALGRGFCLSDHADWPALLRTIEQSGASRVLAAGGHGVELARYLRETRGLRAEAIAGPVLREEAP